ncbi:SURF1 family protein [Sphingobium algorifonticola]|uniref:SURF1-like protein n=1 Tax=Sphingobium algorifonticola TaxID=2008318 RepID=A0A437J5W1_9SPHN|nr:SURF1 family protein [Sphingobium algorifonticola]RVT40307.1 SURF1 family protein [Sphingobium algorifonticola]
MIRRLPPVATILVLLAVALMIGLGFWQLQRKAEKAAAIAVLRANPAKPPVAFPALPPVDPDLMFRQSTVNCLRVTGWQREAGRAADGSTGYRLIASCATGAEGPGVLVNIGVSPRAEGVPEWSGGQIGGWISQEPDHRPLLSRLLSEAPPLRPMLIARQPAAGLKAATPPDVDAIADNHLAYAVQWFLFAGVALLIYAIAVRKRLRPPDPS